MLGMYKNFTSTLTNITHENYYILLAQTSFCLLSNFFKCSQQLLAEVFITKIYKWSFIDTSNKAGEPILLFKMCISDPIPNMGMNNNKSFMHDSYFVQLSSSQLKIDVGLPGTLLRFPLHPTLEHLVTILIKNLPELLCFQEQN